MPLLSVEALVKEQLLPMMMICGFQLLLVPVPLDLNKQFWNFNNKPPPTYVLPYLLYTAKLSIIKCSLL